MVDYSAVPDHPAADETQDETRDEVPVERCTLPDGREILAVDAEEAQTIWDEISQSPAYLRSVSDLTPDEAIVDVGAHIGLASIHCAAVSPGSPVLAFEPARTTFGCLEVNLAAHVPDAVAIRKAVGSERGSAELTYRPYIPSSSTLYLDPEDESRNLEASLSNVPVDEHLKDLTRRIFDVTWTETVEVTTLSTELRERAVERIGLLKIDVERAELDVLRGVADDDWPRIRRVLAEVHDIDGRVGSVVTLLASRGFSVNVSQWWLFQGGSVYLVLASRDD
ncbi:FkbM family methyltransferase [Spirillospora sp. NBC_00431]